MKALVVLALLVLATPAPGAAQTRSTTDTATAYGARLNAQGEPADLNRRRLNDRVNNRLNDRLSLRIERYRPDNTNDPTAAFRTGRTDGPSAAPAVRPPPLSNPDVDPAPDA